MLSAQSYKMFLKENGFAGKKMWHPRFRYIVYNFKRCA